jgi:Myb-like DNA-binding domain
MEEVDKVQAPASPSIETEENAAKNTLKTINEESTVDGETKPRAVAVADNSNNKSIPAITVDTVSTNNNKNRSGGGVGTGGAREDESDEDDKPSSVSAASQARTPKHANKTKDGEDDKSITIGSDRPGDDEASIATSKASDHGPHPSSSYAGRLFEGGRGGGAFQPTDAAARRQHLHHHPHHHHMSASEHQYYSRSPMQISPGGGRYYERRGIPPGYHSLPPPGPPPPGYYEQRVGGGGGYNDYGPLPSVRSFEGGGPGGPPPHYHHQYGGPPPPHFGPGGGPPSYDSRFNGDPRGYGPPPPHHGGGGRPGHGHPSHYQSDHGFPPSGHGGPPEQYPPRSGRHDGYPPDHGTGGPGVSRAVSSSFDRSVKDGKSGVSNAAKAVGGGPVIRSNKANAEGDTSMASDDDSWKQLKQVHSIDDSAIQEHLGLKKGLPAGKANATDDDDRHPPSNSSSLTNSPTEGPERRAKAAEALLAAAAASAKRQTQPPSSLDELSSVASAQAPMDTSGVEKKSKSGVPESPATHDSASIDLMKCSSGSSALLHLPSHVDPANKRGREERGDSNTAGGPTGTNAAGKSDAELRRAPSGVEEAQPPLKKMKMGAQKKGAQNKTPDLTAKNAPKAKSPESITFSPSATKRPSDVQQVRPSSFAKASPYPGENSFYDRPPTYSYSLDSAPPLPSGGGPGVRKSGHHSLHGNPGLPPRPGSSASSSLTHGQMQDPSNAVVTSIPSWEIQAQDSFGAASVGGGNGLANNFSFQDYMLAASESNLGAVAGNSEKPDGSSNGTQPMTATSLSKMSGPPPGAPSHHPHLGMGGHPALLSHAAIESRNQSFEGGHYHGGGSFHRSDSMDMGYPGPGRPMGPVGRHGPMMSDPGFKHGHTGQFPPHAPSWGTAGSGGSHPSYHGHPPPGSHAYNRMGDYPIMRNYSQDSTHRASPPPGPPGGPRHYMHLNPSGFQPPPEFAAPHNPMGRRPPPAVYIMSSQGSHQQPKRGAGVFSWTKDDDIRLTEVMKKYKNPRDWEPVAKEHGMGKTAKECHERWIRYLKPGVRKGQWTDQEDAIVIEAVQTSSEQPFTRWSDLAQRLPGRVGKQIRDRWVNHLNPNINHLPFSREDDLLLWDGHKKLGKRWVEISTKFFHSSRSENHIKNRWYSASFKKFISNEFGVDAYSGGKSSKGNDKLTKGKRKSFKEEEEDPATQSVGV